MNSFALAAQASTGLGQSHVLDALLAYAALLTRCMRW